MHTERGCKIISAITQQNLNSDVIPTLSPYIIGTSNQPLKMTANHSLHLSFRLVKGVVVGVFIPPVVCVLWLKMS